MEGYLKKYRMKIRTISPVFIGSGQAIGKKEYIYNVKTNQVLIPNLKMMHEDIRARNLESKYINYMLNENQALGMWLKSQGFQFRDYERWLKYRLDAGDTLLNPAVRDGQRSPKEILTFMKDAYGLPYIPGSSIKGMIRTALLAYEINHRGNFEKNKSEIKSASRKEAKRNECLSRENRRLESQAFHTLNKTDKYLDAVNSNMSGLKVSDSAPIDKSNLILSQKIDVTLDGMEKALPVLRETIKPETEILFDITINEQSTYTIHQIIDALDEFNQQCLKYYYNRFGRGSNKQGIVWLGGGCGFVSKTVLYNMYGEDAVGVIDNIFKNTLGKNYYKHKHTKDTSLGIAPHVCKCTRYQGKLYSMGMCRMEIIGEC